MSPRFFSPWQNLICPFFTTSILTNFYLLNSASTSKHINYQRNMICFEALVEFVTECKHLLNFVTACVSFFLSFGRDPHPTVTKSDAGSDGTQPASCVDIQNRQFTYSCRCPMYGACQNNVFCGLFCSATLAIRCRSKAPFVHERLKAPNTSPKAVEPDP